MIFVIFKYLQTRVVQNHFTSPKNKWKMTVRCFSGKSNLPRIPATLPDQFVFGQVRRVRSSYLLDEHTLKQFFF